MKQLSPDPDGNGPSRESESFGWNLMALVALSFPPSAMLAPYLERFLRGRSQSIIVRHMHQSQLGGALMVAPSPMDVLKIRGRGRVDFYLTQPRTDISFE